MESLRDHLQQMNGEIFAEDQIMKKLEEVITKVIVGELHHEMMVMSGPQYIIPPHDPIVFLEKD